MSIISDNDVLKLGHRRRSSDGDTPRVNWTLVVTIILAAIGWMWAGLGDYRRVSDRVTRLEAQIEVMAPRMERMESKLDRLLERTGAKQP